MNKMILHQKAVTQETVLQTVSQAFHENWRIVMSMRLFTEIKQQWAISVLGGGGGWG